nr:CBM_HP1_G0001040.mRNA.1.CDS.1 [Saccharomyces cerevisiae]
MGLFKNIPTEERLYLDNRQTKACLLNAIDVNKTHLYQPGDYVFLVPVVFSNHIPETIYLPSARVSHRLRPVQQRQSIERVSIVKIQTLRNPLCRQTLLHHKLHYIFIKTYRNRIARPGPGGYSNICLVKLKSSTHELTSTENEESGEEDIFAETPPPVAVSTANKPIYINRVWTDSLSYEISFAQKYVSLNSEVPIKIKLAPICKNVCVKRIHVSITERVTFVSKGYEYEYDQTDPVAKDPYNPYSLDFASQEKKGKKCIII